MAAAKKEPSRRDRVVLAVVVALVSLGAVAGVAYVRFWRFAPSASVASGSAPGSASAPPRRKRSVGLAPLAGPSELELGVDAGNALVLAPVGATDSRPVLVVLGASGDACRHWRKLSRGYGFVLCPAPTQPDRLSAVQKALRASLVAVRRRFGDYISPGPVVLIGVRTSAAPAVSVLRQEPAFFARVGLVDGGFSAWTSGTATIFAKRGGKRVLLVCSTPGCAKPAGDAAFLTRRAGALSRVSGPDTGGTTSRPEFAWLIAHDPAWKPPP